MNSFTYSSELVNAPNAPPCVHYIWVNEMDKIIVYSFKTHKEAEKFVEFEGQNGKECGYFESFHLLTFKETKQHCKMTEFDDKHSLWDVLKSSVMSVFHSL